MRMRPSWATLFSFCVLSCSVYFKTHRVPSRSNKGTESISFLNNSCKEDSLKAALFKSMFTCQQSSSSLPLLPPPVDQWNNMTSGICIASPACTYTCTSSNETVTHLQKQRLVFWCQLQYHNILLNDSQQLLIVKLEMCHPLESGVEVQRWCQISFLPPAKHHWEEAKSIFINERLKQA